MSTPLAKSACVRQHFEWDLGACKLPLGQRTLLMGIVNVTPDSFSDGGQHLDPERGIAHALRLLDEGADIVDIGGESTRPGAFAVSAEAEMDRILPVIEGVRRARPEALMSVDTYRASVARAAVAAGVRIVNDVSGGLWDARMLPALAALPCGVVLMHMRGKPPEWRTLPPIGDALEVVQQGLRERAAAASVHIAKARIVLDAGFGFGKRLDENYPLLARFEELHGLGFPLLAGVSRKSFLGRTLQGGQARVAAELTPPTDRLSATLAAETALVLKGAHIIRTHDVRVSRDAARIADAIAKAT